MIVVNFKTYQEGSGKGAVSLALVIAGVSQESDVPIIPAVAQIDLKEIVDSVNIPVWVQNIDPITYGAHTGMTLAEEAVRIGAKGTLLNHSENKYKDKEALGFAVAHCKQVGLTTLVFASDLMELENVLKLGPDYVSYEPPELIGSTTVSVSEAKPEIISRAAQICDEYKIPLVVGAGVHSANDVRKSLELGAVGIAVATNIVKSKDPGAALRNLLEGFK